MNVNDIIGLIFILILIYLIYLIYLIFQPPLVEGMSSEEEEEDDYLSNDQLTTLKEKLNRGEYPESITCSQLRKREINTLNKDERVDSLLCRAREHFIDLPFCLEGQFPNGYDLSKCGEGSPEVEDVQGCCWCPPGEHIPGENILLKNRNSPDYREYSSRDCEPIPVDCKVSDWGEWSECSVNCGGGIQTRARAVTINPENGGEECPELIEGQDCNTQACKQEILKETGPQQESPDVYSRRARQIGRKPRRQRPSRRMPSRKRPSRMGPRRTRGTRARPSRRRSSRTRPSSTRSGRSRGSRSSGSPGRPTRKGSNVSRGMM